MFTAAFIILAVAFLFSQIFNQSSFDERSRFANFDDNTNDRRSSDPWDWRRQEREWQRRYEDYQERRRDRGAAWATLIIVVLGVAIYLAYFH